MERKVQEWKKAEVKEQRRLIEKHRTVAFSNLNKVRTPQIQELQRKFRGEVIFKCVKNNLMRLALKESGKAKPNVDKLAERLEGSNVFIFSGINPFKLSIMFQKNKIKLTAKAGDIAISDVKIPEGNTGIAPGPIISEFTELSIPTKIEGGSIWITLDTVVARKGEEISGKLASILSRLNIKPMEAGIILKAAYEDGIIYSEDSLQIDLEAVKKELKEALAYAYSLSFNAMYPTPENLPAILNKAAAEARSLALKAPVFDTDTLPLMLSIGYGEGASLSKRLVDAGVSLNS